MSVISAFGFCSLPFLVRVEIFLVFGPVSDFRLYPGKAGYGGVVFCVCRPSPTSVGVRRSQAGAPCSQPAGVGVQVPPSVSLIPGLGGALVLPGRGGSLGCDGGR